MTVFIQFSSQYLTINQNNQIQYIPISLYFDKEGNTIINQQEITDKKTTIYTKFIQHFLYSPTKRIQTYQIKYLDENILFNELSLLVVYLKELCKQFKDKENIIFILPNEVKETTEIANILHSVFNYLGCAHLLSETIKIVSLNYKILL